MGGRAARGGNAGRPPPMNGLVFLDTSFWIAYRDERQEQHAAARRILLDVFRRRQRLVTTFPVICEIQAYFSRSQPRKAAVLADLWENPVLTIAETTHQDQIQAIAVLRARPDRSYSLCDSLSFVVMLRLGLARVLTFDDHFRQFGAFEIVT